jgi:predicted dinucleotide-binding enzyme
MAERIGIIGSGQVGRSLGAGFVQHGHEVKIGSRDPSKLDDWVTEHGESASSGTFSEVADFGQIVILATLWSGTESAIDLAGPERLGGKVVIDVTNPLDFGSGFPPKLALGHTDSGGEQVQRWMPYARVVKCFNCVGHAHMVSPDFPDGPPDMFIAGDDGEAKATVTGICEKLGWGVVDAGGISAARLLEPLALLWIGYAAQTKSYDHAFRLLRK